MELHSLQPIRRFPKGQHSFVDLLRDGVVRKRYPSGPCEHFDRELWALRLLVGCPFTPQLVEVDSDMGVIYMTYCGESLWQAPNTHEAKKVIREVTKYAKTLRRQYGIFHNSIRWANICRKDDKTYLIDFGQADTKQSESDPRPLMHLKA